VYLQPTMFLRPWLNCQCTELVGTRRDLLGLLLINSVKNPPTKSGVRDQRRDDVDGFLGTQPLEKATAPRDSRWYRTNVDSY
jgi:hypothetical protein